MFPGPGSPRLNTRPTPPPPEDSGPGHTPLTLLPLER